MTDNEAGVSGDFKAKIIKTDGTGSLKVSDFVDYPASSTPGNVGICLSGGGSRAMTAGMGQLQALKTLTKNGKCLLEQTKAISTVSGGSWVGTTFEYLTDASISDDDYLGTYTPPGNLTKEGLTDLPKSTIGYRCTSNFTIPDLLLQAFWLKLTGTSTHMLWQTLIGIHILGYYGLSEAGAHRPPDSFFTYDGTSLKAITKANPGLSSETAHLIASGASRTRRPFLTCNMSMSIEMPDGSKLLAPVQATPFFTGIFSQPPQARDGDDLPVGGGGIQSFAFSSDLEFFQPPETAEVQQSRQFSLTDAVGVSSAAFAETLIQEAEKFSRDQAAFVRQLQEKTPNVERLLKPHLSEEQVSIFNKAAKKIENLDITQDEINDGKKFESYLLSHDLNLEEDFGSILGGIIDAIVPQYKYWPIVNIRQGTRYPDVKPSFFADAGSLENTAVNNMLSYSDIDNIISFVNAEIPMQAASHGVLDGSGNEIPDTNIKVSSQLPPLFGYQPYVKGVGYKLYEGDSSPNSPVFKFNQVFPSKAFPQLLQGLWNASGSGSGDRGANFSQPLTTMENNWFWVMGGRDVTVLWVYLNPINNWKKALSQEALTLLRDTKNFPNYNTFTQLELSTFEVSLLANLTAWNLLEDSPNAILDMYR